MPPAVDRSPARMAAAYCLLLWLLPLALFGAPGDTVHQTIATAVQALSNGTTLTIEGDPLVSRIVLPALYERHGNAPLWSNRRAIDQLLTVIRSIDREGLVPADYHLGALEALQQRLKAPRRRN